MRQRRPTPSKCEEEQSPPESSREEQPCRVIEATTDTPTLHPLRVEARLIDEELQRAERQPISLLDLADEEVEEVEEAEFYKEDGGGDEIDAEFARRVQEHFQNRVQA